MGSRAVPGILVLAMLLAVLLGGCASKGPEQATGATSTTGAGWTGTLHGLVVDAAIRPLSGVHVVIPGQEGQGDREADTDAAGQFSFAGLEPGSHVLRATKPGYAEAQQVVELDPAASDPPAVKVQLASLPSSTPYVQAFKFNGFLDCSLSVVALCSFANGATCGIDFVPCSGNVTNDRFAIVLPIERPPHLVQSEMVWQTTTPASQNLLLWHSRAAKADGAFNDSCSACWAQGPSPLLLASNQTRAEAERFGVDNDVELRVFSGGINGTGGPADPNGCTTAPEAPLVGARRYCGLGYSVEQGFTIYTHVFYGYAPPPGWRFTQEPDVPAPPT